MKTKSPRSRPSPLLPSALALLLLAAGLTGCASAGAGADITPSAPPPPVKKPFQPPSYDATEWRSDDYGFSVHYPADFQEQAGQGSLLTAASPAMAPRIDVAVAPVSGDTSLEAVGSQLEALFAQLGGGEAKVTGSKESTLQDGITPAMEFVIDWQFQGSIPLQSLVLVAPQDDSNAINVTVSNLAGGDLDELREIAYTLYLD